MLTPDPPYSAGSAYPNRPRSAAAARRSAGIASVSSISSSRGSTFSRTNRRTASRTSPNVASSMGHLRLRCSHQLFPNGTARATRAPRPRGTRAGISRHRWSWVRAGSQSLPYLLVTLHSIRGALSCLAGGAHAPEHDFRLVHRETRVLGRGQARLGSGHAVDILSAAAPAAHEMVMAVPDPALVADRT